MKRTATISFDSGKGNKLRIKFPEVEESKIGFLTFDDGIQSGTEEVLKVLKEEGVRATFF